MKFILAWLNLALGVVLLPFVALGWIARVIVIFTIAGWALSDKYAGVRDLKGRK